MIEVITIETPSLGDRSYLVTDGTDAVMIDPQRDIDRIVSLLEERGLTLTHVLETHIHNDYVTGGHALAARYGAKYCVNAADHVTYERHPVSDGDVLESGGMSIRVIHTPGHTPTHISFALSDRDGNSLGVFTGGSMLFGTVGRPDLISQEMTEELARAQYRSVRRLASELPDQTIVHPTHGFGSHCSSIQTTKASSTVGQERTDNPALVHDEEEFLSILIGGLTPYPTYYKFMAPINVTGPEAFDATPPELLDVAHVTELLRGGAWVIDLRGRRDFAAGFLPGAVNAELRNDLPNYLGWFVPFSEPLVLLGDDEAVVAEAQRMLARIGYDRLRGRTIADTATLTAHGEVRTMRVGTFKDLDEVDPAERHVLDVRDTWEFESGHHADAIHVPFHDLSAHLDDLPTDRPIWVYCATGARATIATSFLVRNGFDIVLLDDFCLPGDVPGRTTAKSTT